MTKGATFSQIIQRSIGEGIQPAGGSIAGDGVVEALRVKTLEPFTKARKVVRRKGSDCAFDVFDSHGP